MPSGTELMSDMGPKKPHDWPINDRERFLDEVVRLLRSFIAHPSYKTKDALVNLACNYDYCQKPKLGMHRVTDYEVMLVNSIYQQARHYFLDFLKSRLYEIVADVSLTEKNVQMGWAMRSAQEPRRFEPIEAYKRLERPLRLFYFGYQEYTLFVYHLNLYYHFLIRIHLDHLRIDAYQKYFYK